MPFLNLPSLAARARELGFVAAGAAPARKPLFYDRFVAWIKAGHHADMGWLETRLALRAHPAQLLPGCRTVIALAYPYATGRWATSDGNTLARYAEPLRPDYHTRLRALARELVRQLSRDHPQSRSRICVDSAPILERSWAYAAGIGFFGRNNALYVPGVGSYVFLAEILTTVPLSSGPPRRLPSSCGDCRKCLAACPTGALEAPYRCDARRCLAYWTIEARQPIPPALAAGMGTCFFGCDVCQEACPLNPPPSETTRLPISRADLLGMEAEAFQACFGHTALTRVGLARIQAHLRALTTG